MKRIATPAAERGLPGPIALQTQYSLVERSADYEHGPAATDLGMGVVPWSPLAGGFLSDKYERGDEKPEGDGRLASDNPLGQTPFTDGGSPRKLVCSGHDLAGVHAVRTRADVTQMMNELADVERVVIGGGYIGLQAAAVLSNRCSTAR